MNRLSLRKALTSSFCLTVFTCVRVPAQGQDKATAVGNPQGFSLEIKTPQSEVAPKTSVDLMVKLKNTSAQELEVIQSNANLREAKDRTPLPSPSGGFLVTAKDERGRPVPYTRYGLSFFGADWPSQMDGGQPSVVSANSLPFPVPLKPGAEVTQVLPLNRLVDLSQSGTYFITAQRRVFKSGTREIADVTSNTIQIKVIEPDDSPLVKKPTEADWKGVEEPIDPNFRWTKAPSASWKRGDEWWLAVERYYTKVPAMPASQLQDLQKALQRAETPPELAASILRQAQEKPAGELPFAVERWKILVQIEGSMTLNGREFWRVVFRPTISAPGSDSARTVWRTLVGKEDGQTHEVAQFPDLEAHPTRRLGDSVFPVDERYASPFEIFPVHLPVPVDAKQKGTTYQLRISTQDTAKGRTATATFGDNRRTSTITQRWLPGAKWWSEYERHDGDFILRAKRVEFKP